LAGFGDPRCYLGSFHFRPHLFAMIKEIYNDYKSLGLTIIPIEWDVKKKQPVSHRNWATETDFDLYSKHNGLMIKTENNFGAIDFDLKNTKNKNLFKQWMDIITNDNPDILNKVFIEETRNQGYHVWIKYNNLPKKMALADADDGSEVIALYCNGPLVYTYPTPGYTEFYQSMLDVQDLNDDDFNYLLSISQYFNEYKPAYDPTKKAINYPKGYENELIDYDKNISDDAFDTILNDIGIESIPDFRYSNKDKFHAYKRKGSTSNAISAKVYYQSRRVLLFSASLHNFPNWHNKHEYPVWSLSPSFILFYHLKRSWENVFEHIGIKKQSGLSFPFDIFPQAVKESIFEVAKERSMSPEFLATAGIWAVSSLAGASYESEIGSAKNILYCFLIAPMSVGKSPAQEVMAQNPMKRILEQSDRMYATDLKLWEGRKAKAQIDKKPFFESRPKRFIPIVKDGTIEGYISLCMDQKTGIGIYIDEAEDILNAGAYKSNNNTISFLTQAFGGGRFVQSRANRENERIVKNLNINLLMGTQTERIQNIFPMDRITSGFASRFLMCESDYKLLNIEADPFSRSREICQDWTDILSQVYNNAKRYNETENEPVKINLTNEAKETYRIIYKADLVAANQRIENRVEGYILGTHAKMSNYMGRLTQIVAILNNPSNPIITKEIVILSQKLYKYYSETTLKIISRLHTSNETGLPEKLENLYNALPDQFNRKEAAEICKKINLSERKFDSSMRTKDFSSLFVKISQGVYQKRI
jgi:hypothetical protein